MKKIITTVIAALTAATLAAQSPNVVVSMATTADNTLQFNAAVTGCGTFTIQLQIKNAVNAKSNPDNRHAEAEAEAGILLTTDKSGMIYTLEAENPAQPATADFTWVWIQGDIFATPNLGFIYRLPIATGHDTQVTSLVPAKVGMMRDNTANFTMWQLSMGSGDPVFAIRKGIVIRVDRPDPQSLPEGTPDGNTVVVVEHADGTQAIYSCLQDNSVTLAVGDTVYPDTQIASAGVIDNGESGIRLGLYHFTPNRNTLTHPQMISQTDFINPLFLTADGNMLLTDNKTVTAKATKRVVEAERAKKCCRHKF